jgi:hypothetical protein
VKKLGPKIGWLVLLTIAPVASAQVQLGDNTHMNAGGLFTVGYAGDYGNQTPSTHGLNFGASGALNGYYYNPNFLNFNITPYYNQSKADSDYQSLTDASGVTAAANLFTGSHFPGSVGYHYDYNSTGTFGLAGVPNFTTQGNGQGFSINWSALFPDWPTLSVGYQRGSGSGTLYGTTQQSSSTLDLLNIRSSYKWSGFLFNAFYDRTKSNSLFPEFLSGGSPTDDLTRSDGQDIGITTSRNLPWWDGSMFASYTRSDYSTNFGGGTFTSPNTSTYNADSESAGASFHPEPRLSLYANQSYTNNLSGYFIQGLVNGGAAALPVIDLGSNSYSMTAGGGAGYQLTDNISSNAFISYYDQHYYGTSYSGTFVSGMLNYNRKLFDMFTFSAGMVDGYSAAGSNNVGFTGTANYFHRFGLWETSGSLSYAQNVQSVLITDTTSYYYYNANLHRKFNSRVQWTIAFNGNHSGLSSDKSATDSSAGFSTSLSFRSFSATANYLSGTGNSILTPAGIISLPSTPGENLANIIAYNAKSYGGGLSWTPVRRMILTGTYSRSYSTTLSNNIYSNNSTNIFYTQLQYRLRRISLLAGATRFTQGISATGIAPGTVTSYYGGISRWFDFF